jgi:hypothetical protein
MNWKAGDIAILIYEANPPKVYRGQEVAVDGPHFFYKGALRITTTDGERWSCWPWQLKRRDGDVPLSRETEELESEASDAEESSGN